MKKMTMKRERTSRIRCQEKAKGLREIFRRKVGLRNSN